MTQHEPGQLCWPRSPVASFVMSTQIQTTHAGSLPRTPELIEANRARELEDDGFTPKQSSQFDDALAAAVQAVVKRQADIGITIPGDGEYGKDMSAALNYGSWWSYIFGRTSGLEITGADHFEQPAVRSTPGNIQLTSFPDRRDWVRFHDAYNDPDSGITVGEQKVFPAATGPISYSEKGRELVQTDIRNFQTALDAAGYTTGFLSSLSPGSGSRIANEHYDSVDDFLDAWVEVMRPEYKAITDAGLTIQIDDPSIAENWDQINPEPSIPDYLEFTQKRADAINRALEGIPQEQVRFHLCWGSWHGPHTTDIEFKHIAELMLSINAKYFSFEAGNVRHEHEWVVWKDVTLPEDRVIVPGVVSHATNVVEHPELVAQRLLRFAEIVGPERVIGSSDCGFGGRIHPDIAWTKLESLTAGAELASARL